jgi:hypothetical protein
MEKILCPKWGRCKATSHCPLAKRMEGWDVYVFGECPGVRKGLVKRELFIIKELRR